MSYYDEVVLADGAAGYWELDETSGTTADDKNTTNNNDGAYTGTFSLAAVAGAVDADSAVSLPGSTGNYVTIPDANSLDFGDTMTFECWVKVTTLGATYGLISKTGTNGPRLILASSGGGTTCTFRMTRNGTAIVSATTAISDTTTWHHLVMTKNGNSSGSTRLYVDGVDVTGSDTPVAISSTSNVLLLGASATNSQSLDGKIQKVAVYSTVLTPTQVLNHYTIGVLRFTGSTAGTSSTTGETQVSRPLAGDSAATSTSSGDLTIALVDLVGSAAGTSSTSGDINVTFALAGTSTGVSSDTGAINVTYALTGSSAGTSTTAGNLKATWALSGTSTGQSTASATGMHTLGARWRMSDESKWLVTSESRW